MTACTDEARCQAQLVRYQERLRALALELSLAAERERRRIAVGLHDDVGQNLAAMQIQVESLRARLGTDAGAALDEMVAVLKATIQTTRTLTFELCPPALYELGIQAALCALADRMRSRYGTPCDFEHDDTSERLPTDTAIVVHVVVRELLHNVVKHARATHVRIGLLRADGHVQVDVADDGVGFVPRRALSPDAPGPGFGLFSARERLRPIGGTLRVESGPRHGTRVTVRVPSVPPKHGAR